MQNNIETSSQRLERLVKERRTRRIEGTDNVPSENINSIEVNPVKKPPVKEKTTERKTKNTTKRKTKNTTKRKTKKDTIKREIDITPHVLRMLKEKEYSKTKADSCDICLTFDPSVLAGSFAEYIYEEMEINEVNLTVKSVVQQHTVSLFPNKSDELIDSKGAKYKESDLW